MNVLPSSAASLWHGTNPADVVWTVLPIKWTFLYIHIWCISSPRAIIHMTTLGAKGIAESLSPAKKQQQQQCDSYWAARMLSACLCLHSQSERRKFFFVPIKWPQFRQGKLTYRAQRTFLPPVQNHSTDKAEVIIYYESSSVLVTSPKSYTKDRNPAWQGHEKNRDSRVRTPYVTLCHFLSAFFFWKK